MDRFNIDQGKQIKRRKSKWLNQNTTMFIKIRKKLPVVCQIGTILMVAQSVWIKSKRDSIWVRWTDWWVAERSSFSKTQIFPGNITAATDKCSLQSHDITHILTVDSCPLPSHVLQISTLTNKYIQGNSGTYNGSRSIELNFHWFFR